MALKPKKTNVNSDHFSIKLFKFLFTMPVGAYDISSFLKNKLAELNVEVNDEEVSQITKIVGYTVGNNPIKRYLNTFSLIKIIVLDDDEIDDENDVNKIILFATLGIQISYPEIFRLLTQNPNFLTGIKNLEIKLMLI